MQTSRYSVPAMKNALDHIQGLCCFISVAIRRQMWVYTGARFGIRFGPAVEPMFTEPAFERAQLLGAFL